MARFSDPSRPTGTDAAPNAAQLKADIEQGRTGDKVQMSDPGLSPLGTDDEAAGTPPTPERVAAARAYETRERWPEGKADNPALQPRTGPALPLFIGLIVLIGAIFLALLWFR